MKTATRFIAVTMSVLMMLGCILAPTTAFAAGANKTAVKAAESTTDDTEEPGTIKVTRHKGSSGQWVVTSIEATRCGQGYASVSWPSNSGDPDLGFTEDEAARYLAEFAHENATILYTETPSADELANSADKERMGGIISVRERGVTHDDQLERMLNELSYEVGNALDVICKDDTGIAYLTISDELQAAYKLLDVREVVTQYVGTKVLLDEIDDARLALSDAVLQAKSAVRASETPITHINGFETEMG